MKILKKILLAILVLVVLVFLVALIAPKHYAVEREIVINKPVSEVFGYVKYLKNQDNFSVWASMDPNMEKAWKGTDGEVGFVSAWKSENPDVGSGEQEIIKIDDGKRIDFELRFFEPWESESMAYIETEALLPDETLVKWGFTGKMSVPMNLMMLFMNMDEAIGNDFDKGLDNLKNILESK